MTLDETMARLEALADASTKKRYLKNGAGENLFGVKRGDVRKLAKEIKRNHELGQALWQTGNVDARFLAILVLRGSKLTPDELEAMVRSTVFLEVTDWVHSQILRKHKHREALRLRWLDADDPKVARLGWHLTADRIVKDAEGLDIGALLDRLDADMGAAHPDVQWAMNFCLAYTGVHHPDHRDRASALGERLGLYRDWPVSKGCISPYAPVWIAEMVSRQG